MSRSHLVAGLACGLALAACAPTVHAQTVDASNIITNADVATLSGYLGQGPLNLTRIFSHVDGDGKTAADFHAAADNKGATFAVLKVNGYNAIIGGYDPQSWDSNGTYHFTPNDADRTGFLFNLTSSVLQRQNTNAQDNANGFTGVGQYQTYDTPSYGPTFGGGHDIYVDNSLSSGYAYNYSYGGTSFNTNIVGSSGATGVTYSNVEVFTFAPAALAPVPEPGSVAAIAALALTGANFLRKRRCSLRK